MSAPTSRQRGWALRLHEPGALLLGRGNWESDDLAFLRRATTISPLSANAWGSGQTLMSCW